MVDRLEIDRPLTKKTIALLKMPISQPQAIDPLSFIRAIAPFPQKAIAPSAIPVS
jgi:hypothetical protein